jgi:hypothetical protein
MKTYNLTAKEYIARHNPTKVGRTAAGVWYEHPIYGDEACLLLVTRDGQIHLSDSYEIDLD